jgi:hypothetical protein
LRPGKLTSSIGPRARADVVSNLKKNGLNGCKSTTTSEVTYMLLPCCSAPSILLSWCCCLFYGVLWCVWSFRPSSPARLPHLQSLFVCSTV